VNDRDIDGSAAAVQQTGRQVAAREWLLRAGTRLLSIRDKLEPARGWRGLLILAVLLFLAGTAWSIQRMHLDWSDLDWEATGLALLLVVPAIWFNAVELQLCARAAGQSMGAGQALYCSNVATLSNLLPLPASLIVRGGALMQRGASLAVSSQIVLAAGAIWLAMAGGISAVAVLRGPAGAVAGLGGLAAVAFIARWIAKRSSARVAWGFIVVRMTLLGLMIARLYFCFEMIGLAVKPMDVAVYTVASILGSAAGVLPGGLGVSEGIAAALAVLVGAQAAAAFLAVGLNRVLGLLGSGLVVLWFLVTAPRRSRT
jgi:hypothetical protein